MSNNDEKYDSIPRYISEIHRSGSIFFGKAYSKYNIGAGQHLFLRILFIKENLTQEDLSNILNIDKATTARAVKKLEEQEYITRERCVDDKRANIIKVTKKAMDIKEEFFAVYDLWKERITETLTEEESEITLKVLKKIALSDSVRRV